MSLSQARGCVCDDLSWAYPFALLIRNYKLASSVNLYRFTHFLDLPFGAIFANLLVGEASPIPFEHHLPIPVRNVSRLSQILCLYPLPVTQENLKYSRCMYLSYLKNTADPQNVSGSSDHLSSYCIFHHLPCFRFHSPQIGRASCRERV